MEINFTWTNYSYICTFLYKYDHTHIDKHINHSEMFLYDNLLTEILQPSLHRKLFVCLLSSKLTLFIFAVLSLLPEILFYYHFYYTENS